MSIARENPAVAARYGDILPRERPVHDGDVFSRRHPKMTRLNRAKLFAPFAALVGFDERVRNQEIDYIPRLEPDAGEAPALNRRLCELRDLTANARLARANGVQIRVEYFEACADDENDAFRVGGRYRTVAGTVLNVDPHARCLTLRCEAGTRTIPFEDIRRIWEAKLIYN